MPGAPVPLLTVDAAGDGVLDASEATAELSCLAQGVVDDPDGDTVATELVWSVNGFELPIAEPNSEVVTLDQLAIALGVPLVRADSITCALRFWDGHDYGPWATAVTAVGNALPTLVGPTVEPVVGGGDFTCSLGATDFDGDVTTVEYAWERLGTSSGIYETLGEASDTLSSATLPRGDEVTCSVVVSDGYGTVSATSAPTAVLNQPPSLSDLVTSWVNGDNDDDAPNAGSTLRCRGTGFSDPEVDATGYRYRWYLGEALLQEEDRTSGNSTFSGQHAKHDEVRCVVAPWDGTDEGDSLEHTFTIANHVPHCAADHDVSIAADETEDVSCECFGLTDEDGDLATTSCQWLLLPRYDVFWSDGSCTLTAANTLAGTRVACEISLTDDEGATSSDVANSSTKITPQAPSVAWDDAGATLSAAGPVRFVDADTVLTCGYAATAVGSNGVGPYYYTSWQLNGWEFDVLTGAPYFGSYDESAQTIGDLQDAYEATWGAGAFGAGATIECQVIARDGVTSVESGWSNTIVLEDAPGVVYSLTATPADEVDIGEQLGCAATRFTPDDGSPLEVRIQATTDDAAATGWYDLALVSEAGDSASATQVVDASLAGHWLRCHTVDLQSDPVRAIAATPVLHSVAASPAASSPCDARVCYVTVSDADADLGFKVKVQVDVRWLVDGLDAGSDSVLSGNLAVGGTTVQVPMGVVSVSDGASVSCAATATKLDLITTAETTSAAVTVSGASPTVGAATLPERARLGDLLTCRASDVTPGCTATPSTAWAWLVDGVEQEGETGQTFDTGGLTGAETVACVARAGVDGGGYGPATTSAGVGLGASTWTIIGSQAQAFAGYGVRVLGDLDGDGYGDLAVGAPNAAPEGLTSAGAVYIVYGRGDGGETWLDDVEAGTGGLMIRGASGGWDAFSTICASSVTWKDCEPGKVGNYAGGASNLPLGDGLGMRVRAPGDMDDDGVPDLVVSAPYAYAHGQYAAGATYIVPGAVLATLEPGATITDAFKLGGGRRFDGEQGVWPSLVWAVLGQEDEQWDAHLAGYGIATGDFDGDGRPDVAIGAPNADPEGQVTNSGRVYVVYTTDDGDDVVWLGDLTNPADPGSEASPPSGYVIEGAGKNDLFSPQYGGVLSGLRDFDGDGGDDLYIAYTGLAVGTYVAPGAVDAPDAALATWEEDGLRRLQSNVIMEGALNDPLNSVTSGKTDWWSRSGTAGDVNGDGLGDLVVPYVEAEDGVTQIEIAVFFGHAGEGKLETNDPDQGVNGFVVEGLSELDEVVNLFSGAIGDVDGDGLDDIGVMTRGRWPGGDKVGRLWIIFGKTDGATVALADIEAGIGGFGHVVDRGTPSAFTVTGGDVDGDGLSDVVLGIPADSTGAASAGATEVWFGRDLRDLVTLHGDASDEVLQGTSGADVIVGGRGDDVLEGGGGADALSGGAGDDVLAVSDAGFVRVRGGMGIDTLRLDGSMTLDLASVQGLVEGIEQIDLEGLSGGGGSHELSLSGSDLARLSRVSNDLLVFGGADDGVTVTDTGWSYEGAETAGGVMTDVYRKGYVRLLLQQGIVARVPPTIATEALAVDEGAPDGTVIGTIDAVDPDGSGVTIAVDLSDWGSALQFDAQTATLSVLDGTLLDHEATASVTLLVTATDTDGLTVNGTVVLEIVDQNDPPSFSVVNSSTTIDEGTASGTFVALFRADDQDVDEVLTYTLSFEETPGAFALDESSGELTVADGSLLDYETDWFMSLGVTATDQAGATATRSFTVKLADLESIEQVMTAAFRVEDKSVWGEDGVVGSFEIPTQTLTKSLDAETSDGDFNVLDSWYDDLFSLLVESKGDVTTTISAEMSSGDISVYAPAEVTLTFPDDVRLGTPFAVASAWALTDDAMVWGTFPSFVAEVDIAFDNVAFGMEDTSGSKLASIDPWNAITDPPWKIEIEAVEYSGVLFRLLYPDGLTEVVEENYWGYELTSLDLGDVVGSWVPDQTILPEGYTNDNLILGEPVDHDGVHVILTLNEIMTELFGFDAFDKISGQVTYPVDPFGYAVIGYDTWSSWWEFDLDFTLMYGVEVTSVALTMTFENGTVAGPFVLGEDIVAVTLPLDEDTNGDGRVDVTFSYEPEVTLHRWFIPEFAFEWAGKLLGLTAASYEYEYDLAGEIVGETKINDIGWGPVLDEPWIYDWGELHSDSWPLEGFGATTFERSIQLTQ